MSQDPSTTTPAAAATPTPEELTEFRQQVLQVIIDAAAIDPDLVDRGIRELERADAFGCFVDPTTWIKTAKPREVSLKWLRALRAFKRELDPSGGQA